MAIVDLRELNVLHVMRVNLVKCRRLNARNVHPASTPDPSPRLAHSVNLESTKIIMRNHIVISATPIRIQYHMERQSVLHVTRGMGQIRQVEVRLA